MSDTEITMTPASYSALSTIDAPIDAPPLTDPVAVPFTPQELAVSPLSPGPGAQLALHSGIANVTPSDAQLQAMEQIATICRQRAGMHRHRDTERNSQRWVAGAGVATTIFFYAIVGFAWTLQVHIHPSSSSFYNITILLAILLAA